MDILLSIVLLLLQIVFVVLLISMIMSWVDIEQRFAFTRAIRGFVNPLIAPIRAIIPPIGILDISFFVAIILLQVLINIVRSAIGPGGFSILPF
jgi:YggT family protein